MSFFYFILRLNSDAQQISPQHILVIAPAGVRAEIYFKGSDKPVVIDLSTTNGATHVDPSSVVPVPSCTVTIIEKPAVLQTQPQITKEQIDECVRRVAEARKKNPKGAKAYKLARREFELMGVVLPESKREADKVLQSIKSKVYRLKKNKKRVSNWVR